MDAARASEVDVQGLAYEVWPYFELEHAPVELDDARSEMHLMVTRRVHIANTICSCQANLEVQRFLGLGGLLTLRLLGHDLE